jgi:2-haloacid dehalogenase
MSVRAVAFDAFPIFDARPAFALVKQLFPEKGTELCNLWRTRQFEYMWLRTLSGHYRDFWSVTGDALAFAAKAVQVELTSDSHSFLMDAWLRLKCWPDAPAALRVLKNSGLHLVFLSNMTAKMLESGIRNSGLENLFDQVLSTDRVRVYKPDPRAYQMVLDAYRWRRQEVVFAAFAGWDAAGAKRFGYRTFWVNRQNQPVEELGTAPDATGATLDDLVSYVLSKSA